MSDGVGTDSVTFRYLHPGEGSVLSEAIRAAYGDTYDALRLQSHHRPRIAPDDIAVASDHGRKLLDYVPLNLN